MGESKDKAQKPSFFKGVKNEFKKIIWPDKKTLTKETVTVVSVSVILGVIIAVVDFIFKNGIELLVR